MRAREQLFCSRVISGVPAPACNFLDQFGIDVPVWYADRSFVHTVLLERLLKFRHCRGTGIETDMLGDALLRVGECLLQSLSHEEQIRLLLRILLCDVLIDRFWLLAAIMALIGVLKFFLAFWTFPHDITSTVP